MLKFTTQAGQWEVQLCALQSAMCCEFPLAVAGLQILYAIVQFAANASDDRDLRRSVTKTLEDSTAFPAELKNVKDSVSIDTLVMGTNLLTTLWTIGAALICAWLVIRAGRGAVYSRMFLNVGSIYLALTGLLMAFSTGPATMGVGFVLVLGILAILSGVGGVLGIWFMSRPTNEEWFGIPSQEEMLKYIEKYEAQREKQKKDKAEKAQKKDKKR